MEHRHIEYIAGDLTMEGFLIRQDSSELQPLAIVVHDWSGNREFAQDKARYFAKQGFVGFAVDLYGKGKRGSDTDKSINQKLLDELLMDRNVIVTRLQAAIDCALELKNVDATKIIMIGFCMGGLCVLDFARSGADVTGVVSVHGLLTPPATKHITPITAKVLALHGHEDKMVDPQAVLQFENEMTSRNADWQLHVFGKTAHAFTNPKANDPEAGLIYHRLNDKRSWRLINDFAEEVSDGV